MADIKAFGYLMGIPEFKYGKAGYTYFIANRYDDRVISCWAIGSKISVEKRVIEQIKGMNARDDRARLENKHQKRQTMTSSSYC